MKNRDGRLLQTLCLPEPGRYARYLYREDGGSLKGGAPNIYTILLTPIRERFMELLVQDIQYANFTKHPNF